MTPQDQAILEAYAAEKGLNKYQLRRIKKQIDTERRIVPVRTTRKNHPQD